MKDIYKPEYFNSVQLDAIYNFCVGTTKAFINEKDEELQIWYDYHFGKWPIDPIRKEVSKILSNTSVEEVFQPWAFAVLKGVDFSIAETTELRNEDLGRVKRLEILYRLTDNTEILLTKQSGYGGSFREWHVINTGKFFNRISYKIDLPIFDFSIGYLDGYEKNRYKNIENFGRVISIREPRSSQRANVVSYDVLLERGNELTRISVSIFPDHEFKYLYNLTFFGQCRNSIDAEKWSMAKHIYISPNDIWLTRYREATKKDLWY
jgi:hypothetical protein